MSSWGISLKEEQRNLKGGVRQGYTEYNNTKVCYT
jgi:hypothetical protein